MLQKRRALIKRDRRSRTKPTPAAHPKSAPNASPCQRKNAVPSPSPCCLESSSSSGSSIQRIGRRCDRDGRSKNEKRRWNTKAGDERTWTKLDRHGKRRTRRSHVNSRTGTSGWWSCSSPRGSGRVDGAVAAGVGVVRHVWRCCVCYANAAVRDSVRCADVALRVGLSRCWLWRDCCVVVVVLMIWKIGGDQYMALGLRCETVS